MPAKRILWVGIVGLLSSGGLFCALSYRPPLLRADHALDPAKLIDQLGFAWHHNRAFWYEAQRRDQDARRQYLASAWYRPRFLHKYLGAPLGERTLTTDDWRRIGTLYVESGLYRIASEALGRAIALGASDARTFEDLARAEERTGGTMDALKWYQQALDLDDTRFRSLAGLERLGSSREEQGLRVRLEDMATKELAARKMIADVGSVAIGGGWNLWTNGTLSADARLLAGRKLIRVFARGSVSAKQWPLMALLVDGREIDRRTVAAEQWRAFDFSLDLTETDVYRISIKFLNDFNDKRTGEDRNLYVQKIVFESAPPNDPRGSSNFSSSDATGSATIPLSAEFSDRT